MKKRPEKLNPAIRNLENAFSRLELFLDAPIEDDRDKAGVIQAFEFTFEQFWKTFQKLAEEQGLSAPSPKQALKTALQMGFIVLDEEESWLQMLEDRNLTTHTYKVDLAEQIFNNIQKRHFPAFRDCLKRLRAV